MASRELNNRMKREASTEKNMFDNIRTVSPSISQNRTNLNKILQKKNMELQGPQLFNTLNLDHQVSKQYHIHNDVRYN